jgi:hypothetical protein
MNKYMTNITNANCFDFEKNRFNLFELFFSMIGRGIVPLCPCCNKALLTNEGIKKSKTMTELDIFTLEDLADNMNNPQVIAFVKSAIDAEHIIATHLGGTNHYANLTLMHPRCNRGKGFVPAIKGVNQAIKGCADKYVYISKGKDIHIYDVIPFKNEGIPYYICDNKNPSEIVSFLNSAFK